MTVLIYNNIKFFNIFLNKVIYHNKAYYIIINKKYINNYFTILLFKFYFLYIMFFYKIKIIS